MKPLRDRSIKLLYEFELLLHRREDPTWNLTGLDPWDRVQPAFDTELVIDSVSNHKMTFMTSTRRTVGIVATALVLDAPLVTADRAVIAANLVETIS